MKNIRIVIAQTNPTVGDLKENTNKIISTIQEVDENDIDIIVFPEMAVCGYPAYDLFKLKSFMKEAANENDRLVKSTEYIKTPIIVFGSINTVEDFGVYNSAFVVSKGRVIDVYNKMMLTYYNTFDEKNYFDSGGIVPIYVMGNFSFTVTINEDLLIYPAPWINAVNKANVDLMINISASPYHYGKRQKHELLICAKSFENNIPIVYANLVGGQDDLIFDGNSFVTDINGNIIDHAKPFREDLLFTDISIPDMVDRKNRVQAPILDKWDNLLKKIIIPIKLREKRKNINDKENVNSIISNESIVDLWNSLALGIRDYTRKNGFKKVILGLSGGIDSAVIAALSVYALGSENVIGITLPSEVTSQETKSDAILLANNLDIQLYKIYISEMVESFITAFENSIQDEPSIIAKENLQARIRMINIMTIANTYGYLPLCTGNKSEACVGYCTLHGDLMGGFAPLSNVYKTSVYELANYANYTKEVIPKTTIERPPTAELNKEQTDQDILPPYEILDKILQLYIDTRLSVDEIISMNICDKETLIKVVGMIKTSEFKRRQAPTGINTSSILCSKHRVFPITSKFDEQVKNKDTLEI